MLANHIYNYVYLRIVVARSDSKLSHCKIGQSKNRPSSNLSSYRNINAISNEQITILVA